MEIIAQGEDQHSGYYGKWSCPKCLCQWNLGRHDPEPAYAHGVYSMPCPSCNTDVRRESGHLQVIALFGEQTLQNPARLL